MKAAQSTARARKSRANPPRTEGLTTLDRDRASSIADEGGTSAATVEAQRPPTSTSAPNRSRRDRSRCDAALSQAGTGEEMNERIGNLDYLRPAAAVAFRV